MTFTYDGTYEGLMSVVFEAYRLDARVERIQPEEAYVASLFERPTYVETDAAHATRVRKGTVAKASARADKLLHRAFHTERPDVEMRIYRFLRLAFDGGEDPTEHYGHDDVLQLHRLDKQMGREIHRMHAFVRFQKTRDGLYYSVVQPDFNVLPFLGEHFADRYADQDWVIYDSRRHFGLHYDQQRTRYVTFDETPARALETLSRDVITDDEPFFQELWKTYFKHTNIEERKNMKLHLQHVPKRYWKYLVEKDGQQKKYSNDWIDSGRPSQRRLKR